MLSHTSDCFMKLCSRCNLPSTKASRDWRKRQILVCAELSAHFAQLLCTHFDVQILVLCGAPMHILAQNLRRFFFSVLALENRVFQKRKIG